MSKVGENILKLVAQYPETTKNYNLLITYYWSHIENAQNYTDVLNCTSSESITRQFRKLVSDGSIILDKDNKAIRKHKEQEYREEYSS